MKRFITSFLIVVNLFLLCINAAPFVTAEDGISYAFAGDANYIRFATMAKLGLIHEDFLQREPSSKLTKGEFAAVVLKTFDMNNSGIAAANPPFSDVSVNTPYFKEIGILYRMGIVNGAADGKFYPDKTIAFNEAAVIVLKLLGYQPMIDTLGGYSSGVTNTAQKIGLLNGITLDSSEPDFSQIIRLLFNSLSVDEMRFVGAGQYEIIEDSSIFYSRYALHYESGIVTANAMSALYSDKEARGNHVLVDDVEYYDPDGVASELLGYQIDFLYKNEQDEREIFIAFMNAKNSVLNITAENVISGEDGELEFTDADGKVQTADMDFNLSVIYNGKVDLESVGFDWLPKEGEIKLLSNDNSGVYNVVFVNSYQSHIVKSVDAAGRTIQTRSGVAVRLDDDDVVYKQNRKIDVGDIQRDQVISVAESRNKTYKTIYVSDSIVQGSVTEISDENICINGMEYPLSKEFKMNDAQNVTPGFNADFLLDYKGKISFFLNQQHEGYQYGFCTAIQETDRGLAEPQIKLFDLTGKFVNYELSDKVKVIGKKLGEGESAIDCFKDASGAFQRQLIKFRTDNENKINCLSFAVTDATDDARYLVMNHAKESRIWRPSARSFNGTIGMNEAVKVILVPNDPAMGGNEEGYAVTTFSVFANDASYEVEAFDCSKADVPKVLVAYAQKASIGVSTQVSVIENISTGLDGDGNAALKVVYWHQNAKTTAFFADNVTIDGTKYNTNSVSTILGRGDCVRVGTDFSGRIDTVERITDMSADDPTMGKPNPSNADFTAKFRTVYGMITEREGNNILLRNMSGSLTESYSLWYTGTRFTYCDLTRKGGFTAANASYLDRTIGSDDYAVLYQTENCLARNVIIYKIR